MTDRDAKLSRKEFLRTFATLAAYSVPALTVLACSDPDPDDNDDGCQDWSCSGTGESESCECVDGSVTVISSSSSDIFG